MRQSPITQREVERKLQVHGLFALPDLVSAETGAASVDQQEPRAMVAVYHDTPSLRLFRWGVTLRRRTGGSDEGWHMKLPVEGADGGTRDEIQLPLDAGEAGAVPAALSGIVEALVRDERLQPVVTLSTQRTPYILRDADGTAFAELVDDTVSVLDGDRVLEQFREIEVEALTDDSSMLEPVVEALARAGARPGGDSKAARAIGPAASAPPDVVIAPWPTRRGPASDAIRCYLATHVHRLLLQDVRVRRNLPDSVHQMRVATRRLRSGLRVFRPLLDPEWADGLREELAWLAATLGANRDAEVLERRLLDLARLLPDDLVDEATGVIAETFGSRVGDARAVVLEALATERHHSLLVRLVDAARDPHMTEAAAQACDAVLPTTTARAFSRLRRRVGALDAHGSSLDWHEARIAAKRARYAAEATAPVLGDDMKRLAVALEDVTELLGEHQDSAVAQAALRDLAEDASSRAAFALGIMHAEELGKELAARRDMRRLWPRVRNTARKAGM